MLIHKNSVNVLQYCNGMNGFYNACVESVVFAWSEIHGQLVLLSCSFSC